MYKKFIPLPAWFVRLHHQTQNPLSKKEKICSIGENISTGKVNSSLIYSLNTQL